VENRYPKSSQKYLEFWMKKKSEKRVSRKDAKYKKLQIRSKKSLPAARQAGEIRNNFK